ncbi:MAG TPA: hypothetical protein VIL66_08620 [Bacillota bacterium]
MKKLSVIMLALAMTLSMAVVASAAEFAPYLGGEFQVTYDGSEAEEYTPIEVENGGNWARFKMMLTGTVEDEETGTWAKIGTKLSTWNTEEAAPIYEAGIKGIGGVLDIWYNSHEYENAKRGQIPLYQVMAKFGGDPMFDKAPGNVFAADFNSGNIRANLGVDINKGSEDGNVLLIGACTFGFDGGEVRAAIQSDKASDKIFLVGGAYELGFGKIELDFLSNSPDEGDSTSYVQGSVSLADLGLKGTFVFDQKFYFPTDGGYGVGVEFTGIENVVLGAKMLMAADDADENDENAITDFYAGYNFGVFETRVGSYKAGKDGDSVFYAAAHVGMW